jgi:hypothetical protein
VEVVIAQSGDIHFVVTWSIVHPIISKVQSGMGGVAGCSFEGSIDVLCVGLPNQFSFIEVLSQ